MIKLLIAFIAGGVNAFAFAPFGWWPLCLISFGTLFALWHQSNRRAAAQQGFVFGAGMFGIGTTWMYVSAHVYGGMPALLAGFCIFVLTMIVSLYPAFAGFAQGHLSKYRLGARAIFIMPAICTLIEAVRAWAFSGFPWLTTGYAMIDTPLAGLAPAGGVYFVSLLTLMSAGAIFVLIFDWTRANMLLALVPALGWVAGWQLPNLPMTFERGESFSVALVQNNVPLQLKWDAAQQKKTIDEYVAVSNEWRDVDLVVWPEAALPEMFDSVPEEFIAQLREHPADFIFGTLAREQRDGQWKLYNSIAALGDQSVHFYHKQHLVPFGEYVPLSTLLRPVLAWLEIPMSNFSAWREPQLPLPAAGTFFAASICYEDAFPEEWREQVAAAGALININEDAWFGDSLAPHQRLQMARFRAVESGRPMLRASNNGLSAVINWRGKVEILGAQFAKDVLRADVQPRAGVTIFAAFGNLPAFGLVVLMLAFALLFGRRRMR